MALVSQIYNPPGQWTDLVFWWCIVSLSLAWVFGSQAVGIASVIGIPVWTVAQAAEQMNWWRFVAVTDLRIWFPILRSGILPLLQEPTFCERPAAGSRLVLAASALVGLFARGGICEQPHW